MKITSKEITALGNIIVTVSTDWDEDDNMTDWCLAHQCGKKVAIRRYAFKTEAELTMFRLRWES